MNAQKQTQELTIGLLLLITTIVGGIAWVLVWVYKMIIKNKSKK